MQNNQVYGLFCVLYMLMMSTLAIGQSYIDVYFKSRGVDGSVLIYDEKNNQWIFNNEDEVLKPLPPAGLFNIFNALVGLQEGVISISEDQSALWDKTKYYYFGEHQPHWECNTTLSEALKNHTDWYFKRISDSVDWDIYQKYIDENNYSIKLQNVTLPYFWNFGGILSSQDAQLRFLMALYYKKLSFSPQYQEYLIKQMRYAQNGNKTLHLYDTFTIYQGREISWLIGILKTSNNRYFFSIQTNHSIETPVINHLNIKYIILKEVFRDRM